MTAQAKNRLSKALIGIACGIAGLVIGNALLNFGQGAMAGNQASRDIVRLDKKIDEHVNCNKAFELGVNLALEKKANVEDFRQYDARMMRIENIMIDNNKMLKTTRQGDDNRTYKIKNNKYEGGMHFDTIR